MKTFGFFLRDVKRWSLRKLRLSPYRTSQKDSPAKNSVEANFCALPWLHYFTSELGHNFPCCISTDVHLPNVNALGMKYKVFREKDFVESWNSRFMKTLRKEMLQGKRPQACTKCYIFDDLGIQSHRVGANIRWADRIPQLMKDTKADGHIDMKLLSADIRMGNQCNLRCRMCSPLNSKNLVADWKALKKIGPLKSKKYLELDWFKQPEFWNLFAKYSQDLEALHFAGGEPFLIKQHFAFLQNLADQGSSSRITLSYNTNMTVLPQELLELWKHFKSVHVMASLDGTKDVNHYIRYPSNWERIQKNIHYLHSNIESLKIGSLDFNITVQIYNIFNLPELIDFILREYPLANAPVLSPLFGPEEFSLQVLPKEIKQELTQELTEYLESRRTQWTESFARSFEGLITFMNEKDHSHLLPRFKKRMEGFDRAHGQVGTQVIPQLSRVLEGL